MLYIPHLLVLGVQCILVVLTLTPSALLKVSVIVSQVNVLVLLVTKAKVAAVHHALMTAPVMVVVFLIKLLTRSTLEHLPVMKSVHLSAANSGMLTRLCNVPVTVATLDMTVLTESAHMVTMF